jgi:nickel superoxide dismutase
MLYGLLEKANKIKEFKTASAHCDVPCGVYDPVPMQIAAMTVARMTDTILENDAHEEKDHGGKRGVAYQNTITRMVNEKERSAEHVKHEVRIIWGDFYKADQFKKFPQLHDLTHSIMMLASACKQNVDQDKTRELVAKCNEFAGIFWEIKGIKHKTTAYHCKPNLEMVYPEL